MECSHKRSAIQTVEMEVLDNTFKCKTKVCKSCGAFLRGNEFEREYMIWLEKIYKGSRDKFQVQCHFSNNLLKCANKYLESYPGISSTVLMRSLVTIYLTIVDNNEKLSTTFEKLMDLEVYNSFMNNKNKKRVNIQFKPKMIVELISIADLLEITKSAIVEISIVKMMTAITSQDKKLRDFWEKEIKSYLEVFLKAA